MWPNPQETADLVTFTEEIFNGGKLHFLCSVKSHPTTALMLVQGFKLSIFWDIRKNIKYFEKFTTHLTQLISITYMVRL